MNNALLFVILGLKVLVLGLEVRELSTEFLYLFVVYHDGYLPSCDGLVRLVRGSEEVLSWDLNDVGLCLAFHEVNEFGCGLRVAYDVGFASRGLF